MRTIHNLRRFPKMGGNARYLAAVVIAMFAFTAAAEINPGDYITGAICEMSSSSRLTVTGGEGTLIAPLPAEITDLVVTNGASLKIEVDNPFAAKVYICLYGDAANGKFATLDVNGHDLDISAIGNPWENQGDTPQPGPGRVVNTSSTAATITSVKNRRFWGVYEERPGKIALTVENPQGYDKAYVTVPTVRAEGSAPSSFTISGPQQLQVVDTPTKLMFLFEKSYAADDSPEADLGYPIRLSELCPTYNGVPVSVSSVEASSTSGTANKPVDNLIDGLADTFWANGGYDYKKSIVFGVDGPVNGYRIAPMKDIKISEEEWEYNYYRRPRGWKVYEYRMSQMGWYLVDDRTGAGDDFWPKAGQNNSFATNILFSAPSRPGAFTGPGTDLVLNGTHNEPVRIISASAMEVKSLSGTSSGTVRIESGSAFAPGDLTGFLGSFATHSGYGRLFVSGGTVAEQPVSIPSVQNLVVANGGTAPASVLLDNTRTGHFFGTMKDGENGTLGLVKRGAGERVLETEAASYTGPTAVHEGTLTIARRRTYTARYIRFTPLEVRFVLPDANLYNYVWSMNEFILVDGEGNDIAWPSGASVTAENGGQTLNQLIDGNDSTRILVTALASSQSGYPAVTIDAKENVSFSAYRWCSCMQTYPDAADRLPLRWKLEVKSDGGETWETVDTDEYAWSSADQAVSDAGFPDGGQPGVFRGPFAAGGSAAVSSAPYTGALDASFFASGTDRDTSRPLSARYFRIKFYEAQRLGRTGYSYGLELTELSLLKDGARVGWPSSSSATTHGTDVVGSIANLIDNDDMSERYFPQNLPHHVTIDAGESLDFDSYSFTINGGVYPTDRAPKSWVLEISNDGVNYTAVDAVGNWVMPQSVYDNEDHHRTLGPFNVASKHPYLHSSAANSIGDKSPVSIDSGATLKIAANYEKFGPLSGAGTLDLVCGAVAEVNATGDATFSGAVTGDGVFAVCGSATQTLSGATLTGVKTLELNGGTLAGTASFGGGDLTLKFNGGALGAQLSGIGTLNVSGSVKYAVPADNKLHKVTVLSAGVITSESQEKLRTGEIVGGDWSVHTVTDTKVILRNNKSFGLIFIVH